MISLRMLPLLALAGLLSWTPPAAAAPSLPEGRFAGYNLIMVSLSNVGAQHMSLYGYTRKTTPRLDRWAADAVVFENAFTPASWTLPVAASVFTGLYPYSHRIVNRYAENTLSPEVRTLPELLRDAGYRTAAFTGGLDYYSEFSTMRGFQEKPANPNFSGFSLTLPQARRWLARGGKGNFFLFVHGYDTHCPFTPPPSVRGTFSPRDPKGVTIDPSLCVRGVWKPKRGEFDAYYAGGCVDFPRPSACRRYPDPVPITRADVDYLRDLYDEEVLAADALVADFLGSLDKAVLKKTIVVVFAEHGEMFAKHGRFGRAGTMRGTLYDDVVHIPLLLRLPGVPGRRVGGLVELTDLAPTLAALLGVRIPHRIDGKDLRPVLAGGPPVHDAVFAGLPFPGPNPPYETVSVNDCVRSADWKLIRETVWKQGRWHAFKRSALRRLGLPAPAPQESVELYDLARDPQELADLSASRPDKVQSLLKVLENWRNACRRGSSRRLKTQAVSAELLEDAKQHGYWQ